MKPNFYVHTSPKLSRWFFLKSKWQCRNNIIVGLWCDRILVKRGWSVKIVKELPSAQSLMGSSNAWRLNLWIDSGKPVRSKYAHLWHERKSRGIYNG